jgi:hypothetical protein
MSLYYAILSFVFLVASLWLGISGGDPVWAKLALAGSFASLLFSWLSGRLTR